MTTEERPDMRERERAARASPPERPPRELNDDVARLVRLAGGTGVPYNPSGPVAPLDEVRLGRVRTAVHGAWRDELVARQLKTRRRRLTVTVVLAAAASVVIAFAFWGPIRTPASVPPSVVAHIDQITGQITGQATGSLAPHSSYGAGDTVVAASTVTTSAGTLAMTLTSGVHLRLDTSSSVRLDSATDVALERGAVYVDSAGAHPIGSLSPGTSARSTAFRAPRASPRGAPLLPGASPISIHTPAGLVRDIGTQFQVRIEVRPGGSSVRIRVRDGQVRVTDTNGMDAHAGAGEELFSRPDGSGRSIDRRPTAVTGSDWAWAERAAPTFSVEGKTLGAFLDWVSREGAWTVTFADANFSKAARATVLYGRPDLLKGLTLTEALDVILRTCGLRHRIVRHRIVIERETSAGATQW